MSTAKAYLSVWAITLQLGLFADDQFHPRRLGFDVRDRRTQVGRDGQYQQGERVRQTLTAHLDVLVGRDARILHRMLRLKSQKWPTISNWMADGKMSFVVTKMTREPVNWDDEDTIQRTGWAECRTRATSRDSLASASAAAKFTYTLLMESPSPDAPLPTSMTCTSLSQQKGKRLSTTLARQ